MTKPRSTLLTLELRARQCLAEMAFTTVQAEHAVKNRNGVGLHDYLREMSLMTSEFESLIEEIEAMEGDG